MRPSASRPPPTSPCSGWRRSVGQTTEERPTSRGRGRIKRAQQDQDKEELRNAFDITWPTVVCIMLKETKQGQPIRAVQAYEALEEEKQAVRSYACNHTELRHRELAWRMIDEDVAYVSPSTVYRILREANLVCPWRRRTKRHREELEKAQRPNERWGTDLMYLRIGAGQYYLVTFLDEYSRYLLH